MNGGADDGGKELLMSTHFTSSHFCSVYSRLSIWCWVGEREARWSDDRFYLLTQNVFLCVRSLYMLILFWTFC